MPPKKPVRTEHELFRSRLENMIDMEHALVKLAGLIDWSRFDEAYGRFYHEKGRPGLSTRLMAGLHLLKHMEGRTVGRSRLRTVDREPVLPVFLRRTVLPSQAGA